MQPTLAPGDFVVVDLRRGERIEPEALVVATVPGEAVVVVKRVRSRGDHSFYLGSDNPLEGRDSRHFGSVPGSAIIGEVALHIDVGHLKSYWRPAVGRS